MSSFNKSTNPMLRDSSFNRAVESGGTLEMTVKGAVNKVALLFAILAAGGVFAWTSDSAVFQTYGALVFLMIAGMVLCLVATFVPKTSPFTSPFYAFVEGMLLGTLSKIFNNFYNGIIFQAVIMTVGIFLATLVFYKTGIVRVDNRFMIGVFTATIGVGFVYLVDMIMSLFGAQMPFVNDSGLFGILFSLIVVVIASLNFMIDFEYINRAAQAGAPKYMEWYLGFSIIVTFVWLYLEVLRLFSKLAGSK